MDLPTLAVLVFGGILWALWYARELRFLQALCAALFGFFLASSVIAPDITRAVTKVFAWIGTWHT